MGTQIEEALAVGLEEGLLDCPIPELRSNSGSFISPAVNRFVAGEVGASYSRDGETWPTLQSRFRRTVALERNENDMPQMA